MEPAQPILALPPAVAAVRVRVEKALEGFLGERRSELAALDPEASLLVDEVARLVQAGGKRIRPAFCYWGYRAAGGPDNESIVLAASALELLHTFALIHDDVMDASATRRGVPTSHVYLAARAKERGDPDPDRFGRSAAVLVGDMAAVLADRLLRDSGFPPDRLQVALRAYDRMRSDMAVGQLLDVSGAAAPGDARASLVASLKTGSYTVQGPLEIGAILAGGSGWALTCLAHYGAPLGEAFQLADDLTDEDTGADAAGLRRRIDALVTRAKSALDPAALSPEAVGILRALADLVAGA